MQAPRVIPKIFKEEAGAHAETGEHARLSAFIGAIAVADLVKTTLGPRGMDKILQPLERQDKVSFTNDGATILKSIPVDNAAAKIIIDVSKTQDEEVGDGTTSVAVLAGELLKQAEELVHQKIHPQTVIRGYRKAVRVARDALVASSIDHRNDEAKFREDLFNIAATTLSSKVLAAKKEYFAEMAVKAVLRLRGSTDLKHIQFIKKIGGSIMDSYLDEGFILDKKIGVGQPTRIENARILVANTSMDHDKIKIHGAGVKVDAVEKVAEIEEAERVKMRSKVEKILKHDINCFINRQLIYNLPESMFTAAKVMAIEHADFEGIERLALVLGGEIASTFDRPELVKLGRCDLIEEIMLGEDRVIRFSGLHKGEACTIVLRGPSKHMLDEAERSLHDALCVLTQTTQTTGTVLGGGCSEMLMAQAVEALVPLTPGKESLAIAAFARALRQIPTIIADNAGLDSADLVAQLRTAHVEGKTTYGLDLERGAIGCMEDLKVKEALKSKLHGLVSAAEAAEQILRVDEIIKCAPRKRERRR